MSSCHNEWSFHFLVAEVRCLKCSPESIFGKFGVNPVCRKLSHEAKSVAQLLLAYFTSWIFKNLLSIAFFELNSIDWMSLWSWNGSFWLITWMTRLAIVYWTHSLGVALWQIFKSSVFACLDSKSLRAVYSVAVCSVPYWSSYLVWRV